MNKPLAAALLGTCTAIIVVFGCSAPSPDGSSLDRGRRTSSGGDDDAAPTEDPGSSGGDVSCADHESVDDRPACDQCARAKCCKFVVACDDAPDCAALIECLDQCTGGDATCPLTCQIAHEKGAGILSDVAGCASTKCKSECPSSVPDGGFDFDAF